MYKNNFFIFLNLFFKLIHQKNLKTHKKTNLKQKKNNVLKNTILSQK
jgi:hypothetical protein